MFGVLSEHSEFSFWVAIVMCVMYVILWYVTGLLNGGRRVRVNCVRASGELFRVKGLGFRV